MEHSKTDASNTSIVLSLPDGVIDLGSGVVNRTGKKPRN
jgi:hypothetical protein